ncbi:hypothetical protein BKA67DRAFT_530010 [Truncatella angustata]|uniref:Zn(2)-C6 fungal-type domain-containing protein n=1 Tax=Truncatella angustata TaxID=152316 RepID=A0A9P9A385_9PEZI|nr:uncharacterized protein BKA67DRAFT_530010 [Truncatella angustata]KAH6659883.1 hypothetical protein BKA67DRAFT_530010 [Truncatella angustata]
MAEVQASVIPPSMQESSGTARKKFATPPVKIACLACRASRTRCTGENPCASCKSRDRECLYKPSRRGGPRVRKRLHISEDNHESISNDTVPLADASASPSLLVENYINPGAGLKNLTEVINDSDTLFDSLFSNTSTFAASNSPPVNGSGPMARSYASDFAILNAYYIWIHPYFPILPPPDVPLLPDAADPLFETRPIDIDESSSPAALAISAILALIPCAQDPSPFAEESILFRRKYAQFLAQSAFESVETESEHPDSAVEPSRALEDSDDEVHRQAFHQRVPVQLESIIALNLLSVYEYAQRGNLKRMRTRANAALMAAMSMSLHTLTQEEDNFSDARRRAWWMTYISVCQSSIVSNMKPAFDVFVPSFTAKMPVIEADAEAWPLYIKSQQAILAATQFVIELNDTMKSHSDMSTRFSARIKVHRYCAFFDLPVFARKNCDLRPLQEKGKIDAQELTHWPSCCSTLVNGQSVHSSHSSGSSPPTLSMHSSPSDGGQSYQSPLTPIFPFSSHQSAKICLKSALNIAQAFDLLPYPNPTTQVSAGPSYIGPFSSIIAPRTMPSFACCAMQCAYVLLMVHDKTQTMYSGWNGDTGSLANNLLGRLQQGILSILGTLENYGTAFEALSGMRDQIRDKFS